MSDRKIAESRTIHPRALKELGEEACIVALGVARDLRSGVMPPDDFQMMTWCGTSCCIAGHISARLINLGRADRERIAAKYEHPDRDFQWRFYQRGADGSPGLRDLFNERHPSDPQLAADAIERYVYSGSDKPWKVPAMTGD